MKNEIQHRSGSKRDRTRDRLLVSAQTLLLERTTAGLGLRHITTLSGLVHTSFYNYYRDIPALLTDLSALFGATHLAANAGLDLGNAPPGGPFARVTRQLLRIVSEKPEFGRLVFDVGLPVDLIDAGMRARLKYDLARAVESGRYTVSDIDIGVSITSGAVYGLALDVHRGYLSPDKIDAATAQLLMNLGFAPAAAEHVAYEPFVFPPTPEFPMRWLALPAELQPANGSQE
jgi:AcrR family transcriptional regulator